MGQDYEEMSVEELKDELSERDLPVSGNKAELVARLEKDDAGDQGDQRRGGADVETTTVSRADGSEFEVPVGEDGENPVTPNNPPAKAVLGPSLTAQESPPPPDEEE